MSLDLETILLLCVIIGICVLGIKVTDTKKAVDEIKNKKN